MPGDDGTSFSSAPLRLCGALALGCLALLPGPAAAQPIPGLERPGDKPLELPPFEEPEPPAFELPPLPPLPEPERAPLSRQPRIVVREFRVVGSTVFSPEDFQQVTDPYLNRPTTAEDLQALRERLTVLYVQAGYVNSGAVLPDQQITDGVIEFRIIEGVLDTIEIENNRYFRNRYLESRLERGASEPLNVRDLERELRLLQQDPRIRSIEAQLAPGEKLGEAVLRTRIDEAPPYRFWVDFSNHESPSIGAYRGRLALAHENLTGNGDILRARMGFTEGLDEYEGSYEIPVNRYDSTAGLRYRYSKSDVVEHPFEDLDIESESQTVALTLRQPVYRDVNHDFALGLAAEYRESQTRLLGRDFSFVAGPDDGESNIWVVRAVQEWTYRDLSQVVAARSMMSVGVDIFNATENGASSVPDGQFFSWLGQFQWVRRLDPWGIQLLFRTDAQLAANPLLSLEQLSVGGHSTVRGYRENRLVRDNGVITSLEVRVPVWSSASREALVQLAPFVDYGRSWNTARSEASPRDIWSVGVGLRFSLTRYLAANIYYGKALKDVRTPDDHDLQDDGVTFELTLSY